MTPQTPQILCIDPGFASCGYGVIGLHFMSESLIRMGLVQTKKDDDRKSVDDDLRRTRELFHAFRVLLKGFDGGRIIACSAEAFSMGGGAGGAVSARKVALTVAALICACEIAQVPILQARPQDIRRSLGIDSSILDGKCATEKKTLGKRLTRKAVDEKYANAAELVAGLAQSKLEHPYDAVAAGIASLDSELIRLARMMNA